MEPIAKVLTQRKLLIEVNKNMEKILEMGLFHWKIINF
jgi:hypothetical protein